jgi:hypothetical protein
MKDAGKPKTKQPAQAEEVTAELQQLRPLVREVGEQFLLRCEGEVETLLSLLPTVPPAKLKRMGPQWLKEIRGLKVKPKKGRLKDLKGIDRLLAALGEQMQETLEPLKAKAKPEKSAKKAPAGSVAPGAKDE